MPSLLPVQPSVPFQEFITTLSDAQYTFGFKWNGRDGAWYMDVATDQGDDIQIGVKVVLGSILGGRSVDERLPPGVFQAVDTSGSGLDATFDDFGVRVQVFYYPFTEFAE